MSLVYQADTPVGGRRPGLYLGGKSDAKNRAKLEQWQVTHILNVTPPVQSSIKVSRAQADVMQAGGILLNEWSSAFSSFWRTLNRLVLRITLNRPAPFVISEWWSWIRQPAPRSSWNAPTKWLTLSRPVCVEDRCWCIASEAPRAHRQRCCSFS